MVGASIGACAPHTSGGCLSRILVLVFAGVLNGTITGLTGSNAMAALLSVLLIAGYKVHEVLGLCLVTQIFTLSAALVPLARAEGLPRARCFSPTLSCSTPKSAGAT